MSRERNPAVSAVASDREKLLGELRFAVAVTRLIESGDRMLGRGVTPEWERAHAAACDVLDRCEATGIAEADLDAVIAAGTTDERRGEAS